MGYTVRRHVASSHTLTVSERCMIRLVCPPGLCKTERPLCGCRPPLHVHSAACAPLPGEREHPPFADLYAVSNHSGGTGGGHYYTYARTRSKRKVAEWCPPPPPPPPPPPRPNRSGRDVVALPPSPLSPFLWLPRRFNYNDSYVSPMDARNIRTPAAYVLFYERRSPGAAQPEPEA